MSQPCWGVALILAKAMYALNGCDLVSLSDQVEKPPHLLGGFYVRDAFTTDVTLFQAGQWQEEAVLLRIPRRSGHFQAGSDAGLSLPSTSFLEAKRSSWSVYPCVKSERYYAYPLERIQTSAAHSTCQLFMQLPVERDQCERFVPLPA